MVVTTRRNDTGVNKSMTKGFEKYPSLDKILDRIQSIDLVSDGLYFIAKDLDTGYWVYADTVEREVKVFNKFIDALAYGLHVRPEEIRSIDVIDVKDDSITVRICTEEECDNYKAYIR